MRYSASKNGVTLKCGLGSFKVIENVADGWIICDLLLVFYCSAAVMSSVSTPLGGCAKEIDSLDIEQPTVIDQVIHLGAVISGDAAINQLTTNDTEAAMGEITSAIVLEQSLVSTPLAGCTKEINSVISNGVATDQLVESGRVATGEVGEYKRTVRIVYMCYKGDDASQWRNPKFDPSPCQNPLTDSHKNGRGDYVVDPYSYANVRHNNLSGFMYAHA